MRSSSPSSPRRWRSSARSRSRRSATSRCRPTGSRCAGSRRSLDNPRFISAFWLSLGLGMVSSSVATVLAVPAALAIARHRFPGRDALSAFLLSPLMIPHIVLGVAFLRYFSQIGINGTFASLAAAHVIVILPFALAAGTGRGHRARPGHRARRGVARRAELHGLPPRHAAVDIARHRQRLAARVHHQLRRADGERVHQQSEHHDLAGAHVPADSGHDRSDGGRGLGAADRRDASS